MINRTKLLTCWICVAMACLLTATGGASAEVVFSENFDGGFPPSGWARANYAGGPVAWETNVSAGEKNYTGGTGNAAMIDSFSAGEVAYDAALISPSISVPAGGADLKFKTVFEPWSGDEETQIDVSTNGGASWTNLENWTELTGVEGERTISLNAYSGQNVQLRFH